MEPAAKIPKLSDDEVVLELDFDQIIKTRCYPVTKRAYNEIRIFGDDIQYNLSEIEKVLASSAESVRKLIINVNAESPLKKWKIKMGTLDCILRSLPNLEEIEIKGVEGLTPQVSSRVIQPFLQPEFPN